MFILLAGERVVDDRLTGHSWAQSCSGQSYLTREKGNLKCSIPGLTVEHVIDICILQSKVDYLVIFFCFCRWCGFSLVLV